MSHRSCSPHPLLHALAAAAALALLSAAVPSRGAAALPDPIDRRDLFAFPSTVTSPGDATSAGLALSDLWLGTSVFANPAAPLRRGVALSPVLLRVNRQDLRAVFHDYNETSAFVDGGGAQLGASYGRWSAAAYAWQPVLRHGESGYDGAAPGQPPQLANLSEQQRETRAGAAVSHGTDALRIGAALEWWQRTEDDFLDDQAGPAQGTHESKLTAHGVSPRVGVRMMLGAGGRHPVIMGASAASVPASDVDVHTSVLLTDASQSYDTTWTAHRGSHWEAGLSARVAVTPEFGVLGGVGGASSYDWGTLGVTTGAANTWSLGVEYHDHETPWTARAGYGQQSTTGTPEPRAGMFGLGLGWKLEGFDLDLAALRHSLQRPGKPTSTDDHLTATITAWF